MSDQKNLILFIIVTMVALALFQFLNPSKPVVKPPATTQQAQTQPSGTTQPNAASVPSTQPIAPATAVADAGEQPLGRAAALAASPRVKIDSRRVHGSIALKGARIDDLELVDYHETVDPKSPEIVLLSPRRSPEPYYAEFGWIGDGIVLPGPDTVWRADSEVLSPAHPLTLSWDNGEGLRFLRTIALDENYMFTVTQKVENSGPKSVTLRPYGLISRLGTPPTLGYSVLHEGPIAMLQEKLVEHSYKDLVGKTETTTTTGGWLGFTDKYWLVALVPDQSASFTARFKRFDGGSYKDAYQADNLGATVEVPAGGSAATTERLFTGAKVVNLLRDYESGLGIKNFDYAVDWGWFFFLTKPIFLALDYFNTLLGNFGLAILLLTLIIKLAFLPLAHKSYVSMTAMKKLQPEMLKLRERFADDKAKLNQEMMQLYKVHKVNPAAGCLPIVLQIPVFFSLYKVLLVTIEMRHAPFYGWIHDLSAEDPTNLFTLFGLLPWTPPSILWLGIWPILMGISMFLQQKLNPQPADPVQAKVFMFMPLFMTYILAHFPAGLVIYWTWNNLLSMSQQWFIMRRMGVKA
jgi:YidC/Oxa1 family membrane protein insertase